MPTYKQKRMSLEASQQRAGERTQTTAKKEEEEEDRVTSPTGPLSNVSSWANGDCADDLVESRATSVEAEEGRGEDIVFEAERFERFYELRNEYNTHTIQRVYYEVFRVKTNVHNKEWMLLKILDTRRTTAEKAEERFLWLEELLKIERRSLAEEEAAAAEKINATTTTTTTTTTTPANNNSDDDDNDQGEEYRPISKKQKNPMKSTGASADEDIFVSNPPQKTVAHNKIQRCTRNDGKKWNCKNIAEPGCKHCKLHLRWSSGARSKHNVNNLLLSVSAAAGVQKPPSSSSSLTAAVSLLNNETAGTHHHHYYHTATATATTTTTTTNTKKKKATRITLKRGGDFDRKLEEEENRKQQQRRREHDLKMERRVNKLNNTSSGGPILPILCTIELCDSPNVSVPPLMRMLTAAENSCTNKTISKSINLEDFTGYEQFREHLLSLVDVNNNNNNNNNDDDDDDDDDNNNNNKNTEISCVYWDHFHQIHQVVVGEPWAFFKHKCARLYAKYYPTTTTTVVHNNNNNNNNASQLNNNVLGYQSFGYLPIPLVGSFMHNQNVAFVHQLYR